eukprot:CAMPEP_0183730448 /NCGR_PEP_ID=MMETSP0737-20130205/32856_1 /TAXON_ID=385413 /ORGANISM="Thalassiosira miniscula, Strain CCMP1093" /LENGTH=195 /DNA_ID=CAMNT_0025962953 /DNA_START=104 /DNA_END=691 /DNA_ORIENTATION=-
MAQSSTIALLQPPPTWGIASSTSSDLVLRQKHLKESGMKLNRHQRKNLAKLKQQASLSNMAQEKKKMQQPPSIKAIIASGTGPDGRAEVREMRKKRKMMVRGSVAAVAMSIIVVFVNKSFFSSSVSEQHQQQRMMAEDVATKECSDKEAPTLLEERDGAIGTAPMKTKKEKKWQRRMKQKKSASKKNNFVLFLDE